MLLTFFAYYWSLSVETEPPNKDSFVLSVSFCIEAYGMNLDGTVGNIEDNNSVKLQLKFSLLVQVSGKFELEGAIFELCRGTGVIEVPKHKSNEGEYAGGFCSAADDTITAVSFQPLEI
ncbi:hypothetical protein OIU77_030281 [Salix suchowensis]|uniref:Uncharacterized protein n=1 Tax=Salix suchowensis TaxID=1278906 RepID=A0ABQ9BDE1_9ROSI|nr:hypothetical protein OIU77_030281 [Salix suchowensis]